MPNVRRVKKQIGMVLDLNRQLERLLSLQGEKFVGEVGLPPIKQDELNELKDVMENALNCYIMVGEELFNQIKLCDDMAGHCKVPKSELKKMEYLAKLLGIMDTSEFYAKEWNRRLDELQQH